MVMDATKPDPKHLAFWVIAGATLAASSLLATLLPNTLPASVRMGMFLALFAAGVAIWLLADRRLQRHYRDCVWSEEELAPTRAILSHPAMRLAAILLFVFCLLIVSFSKHHATLIYITMLPINAISAMRTALAPPKPRSGGLIDWKNFKPIQSDHWGEPVRHDGQSPLPL